MVFWADQYMIRITPPYLICVQINFVFFMSYELLAMQENIAWHNVQ
jgi:hypothetical protein